MSMKCLASTSNSEALKIKQKAVKAACKFMLVTTASVLTDKYGFGKQKVQQILKSIEDRADSINQGYINLDDLEQILLEEYGIKII